MSPSDVEAFCEKYEIGVAIQGPRTPLWVAQPDSVRSIVRDSKLFRTDEIDRWKLSLAFPVAEYPEPLNHILHLVGRRGWAYKARIEGPELEPEIVPLPWREDGKFPEAWFWARWDEPWPDDGVVSEEAWGIMSRFVPNDPFR
jgi:hypothetical protein